MLTEQNTKSPA